jgi:hypothetical protein
MARKKATSPESDFSQVTFNYSDTFILTAKYDKQRLFELITAYLLSSNLQTRILVKQGAKITQINPNDITCEGKMFACDEKGEPGTEIFTWYKNLQKTGKHKALIKKCSQTAIEAKSFIERFLPKILDPILASLIPTASLYAKGKKFEAINELSTRISSGIISNITVYKNVLNPKVVAEAPVQNKSETAPDPRGSLRVGGEDGFGGNFAFSYNYVPALLSVNTHITNSINRILWGLQSEIDKLSLDEDLKSEKEALIYESCKEMADAQTQEAENHFFSNIEDKIRFAIAELIDESIAMSKLAIDDINFGKEIKISRQANRKTTIKRLIRWREGAMKRRLNAPSHGGNRRSRGYFLTTEDKIAFVHKVDLLKAPIRNQKNVWQYIISVMEFEEYDSECLAALRAKESLSQVPLRLLQEAFNERGKRFTKNEKVPPEFSPAAFIFKQACLELGVNNPPGYEALKTMYRAFKKEVA